MSRRRLSERPDLHRRVTAARVGRLATVDSDGHPHLVPVCFVAIADVIYSAIDDKPKRGGPLRRLANISATGRASLLIDEYAEDWSQLWWIRLDGAARIVNDPIEAQRAITALIGKYRQYEQHPPRGPVIAIEVARHNAWSA
jgi:PPOX class probable F420-dependent enzyme